MSGALLEVRFQDRSGRSWLKAFVEVGPFGLGEGERAQLLQMIGGEIDDLVLDLTGAVQGRLI